MYAGHFDLSQPLLWTLEGALSPKECQALIEDFEAQGLRFYRYEVGEHFGLHRDGCYQRSEGERSLLTFMVYLNEGFVGGQTGFPELPRTIIPRTGLGLFFQHRLLHEGKTVLQGTKYALRTDVMYRL